MDKKIHNQIVKAFEKILKKEVIDFVGKKSEKAFIKHLTKLFDKELKKVK